MTTLKMFLSSLFLLSIFSWKNEATQPLLLEVENIEVAKGHIWFGVYDSEQSFLNEEKAVAIFGEAVKKEGTLQIKFDQIPFGTYAIAVFHDVNNNGTLDQTFVGIPKEPFAFSQTLRSKWRAPEYEEMKFSFRQANQKLKFKLESW
ncbi:MAG: DUF2141 domain-containing protein [Bacteroidota bacterium]